MEFVFAAFGGSVLHAPTGSVMVEWGDVWFADDPFVLARPDLFSVTPPVVRSTTGRPAPEVSPLPKESLLRRAARRG